MTTYPKIQLSRLRDIGWSLWDPIGLATIEDAWKDSPPADEYDSYLLHVVSLFRQMASEEECVRYLENIEVDHMGLASRHDTRLRTGQTVRAISKYLASLPD